MSIDFLRRLFGSSFQPSKKGSAPVSRRLRMESLENRELLSVTVDDFNAISSQYADLNLGDYADYNIIEITAENLSDANLRGAIATAAGTEQNDLIVVRTTTEQNKITLGGTELAISTSNGSVTIVSFGEKTLTIDANRQSRVFNVAENTVAALGGLTITNGYVASDTGSAYGGGILNGGTLSISTSTISNNSVEIAIHTVGGGGIHNLGQLYISSSAIINNEVTGSYAAQGGGISTTGLLTIVNCTVSGNTLKCGSFIDVTVADAFSSGGGIYASGVLNIQNTTIADNVTNAWNENYYANAYGGGVYISRTGEATMYNTLIARNDVLARGNGTSRAYGEDCFHDNAGGGTIQGYSNLVVTGFYDRSNSIIDINGNITGTSTSPIDAKLGTLTQAVNGTWYYPLLEGSLAINAGSNALIPAGITRDQTGKLRILEKTVDIGAFEYGEVAEVTNEYLTKEWIYTISNLKVGDYVMDADGNQTSYKVDRIFSNSSGLYAIGLVDEETGDSILVFRGAGDPLDTLSDTNVNGIGYAAYFASASELRNWATAKASQGKVSAVGHSLGGTFAQWFAADWTSQGGTLAELETFNATGISKEWADKFVVGNAKVTHHIVDGDFVSMGGEAFVSGAVSIYAVDTGNLTDLHCATLQELEDKYGALVTEITDADVLSDPMFRYTSEHYYQILAHAVDMELKEASTLAKTFAATASDETEPGTTDTATAVFRGSFSQTLKDHASEVVSNAWAKVFKNRLEVSSGLDYITSESVLRVPTGYSFGKYVDGKREDGMVLSGITVRRQTGHPLGTALGLSGTVSGGISLGDWIIEPGILSAGAGLAIGQLTYADPTDPNPMIGSQYKFWGVQLGGGTANDLAEDIVLSSSADISVKKGLNLLGAISIDNGFIGWDADKTALVAGITASAFNLGSIRSWENDNFAVSAKGAEISLYGEAGRDAGVVAGSVVLGGVEYTDRDGQTRKEAFFDANGSIKWNPGTGDLDMNLKGATLFGMSSKEINVKYNQATSTFSIPKTFMEASKFAESPGQYVADKAQNLLRSFEESYIVFDQTRDESGDAVSTKATFECNILPGTRYAKNLAIQYEANAHDGPKYILKGIKAIQNIFSPNVQRISPMSASTLDAASAAGEYLLILEFDGTPGITPRGTIILPNGDRITETDMLSDDRFIYVEGLGSDYLRAYYIVAPISEISQWQFEIDGAVGVVSPTLYEFVPSLDVEATSISQDENGTVHFNIVAGTATPDAVVTVYLDDDSDGFDGFPVYTTTLADLQQNGWTPDDIAGGEYYVYIRVESGDAVPEMIYFGDSFEITTSDPPENLRVTVAARTALSLDWNDVEDATGYEVQRLVGGNYETIYSGTNSEFVDSGLVAGTSYTYRVRAVADGGFSEYSDSVTMMTASATQKDTPVFTDIVEETGQITVAWADMGENMYYVLFKNGVPIPLAEGATSYVDTNPATMNSYVIYAYTDRGWSWSTTKVVNRGPVQAEILSHEILPNGSIQLNWSDTGTSYVLFRGGVPVATSTDPYGTDERPVNGDNNYVLYVYYTDSADRGQWIWSGTYIVNKPTAASTLEAPVDETFESSINGLV